MRRCAFAFVLVIVVAVSLHADDRVLEHGRAVVEYRGESLRIAAAYDYSRTHHDGEWIAFNLGVQSKKARWLKRRDLFLIMPDGREVEAPTQRDIRRARESLYPLAQSSTAFGAETLDRLFRCMPDIDSGSISKYLRRYRHGVCEHFHMWSLYPGLSTRGYVAVNELRTARLEVYFRSPDGAWLAGEYMLAVRGWDAVRLPIVLAGKDHG